MTAHPRQDPIWGRTPTFWLTTALALGLGLRLYFVWAKAGMFFPDEMFQYLEPGHRRIHGSGALFWEFQQGLRNWFLPAYYGALMEIGDTVGLAGWRLHRFLAVHNALASLLIVPLGFRLGRAAGRGDGRLAVMLGMGLAVFPVMAYFAPHTLSEVPAALVVCWAFACWFEAAAQDRREWHRSWFRAGVLLGLIVVMRYSLVVMLPAVLLGTLVGRRWRGLALLAGGLATTVAALAVIDWITWGRPLHSLIAYLGFHMDGGGDMHGTSPWSFYWTAGMLRMLGPAALLLIVPLFAPRARDWRLTAAWLFPVILLSAVAHKEERFLLPIWPLILCAAMAGMLKLSDQLRAVGRIHRWVPAVALSITACLLLASSFHSVLALPMRSSAGVFAAQDHLRREGLATGVLFDFNPYFNESGGSLLDGDAHHWYHGGYLLLDRGIPLVPFDRDLLDHALFDAVILGDRANQRLLEYRADFERVAHFEQSIVLYRRVAE